MIAHSQKKKEGLMKTKFLKATNDFAFKKIFGSEDHKDLLIDFLNSVLELEGDKIIDQVDFLNPIQAPKIFGLKQSIVDILCKDARNIRYVVEMQVSHTPDFEKRAQYYSAKTYIGQLERAEKYPALNQVIFLAIADHVLFEDKPHYRSDHLILDTKSHTNDLKDFSFTFIELPKFTKTEAELKTIEDRWIYFLKHADKDTEIPVLFAGTPIETAYKTLDRYEWSETDILAYEDAALAIVDDENRLETAHKKGVEDGVRQRNREIARKLLAQGTHSEAIAEITGLSLEEMKSL